MKVLLNGLQAGNQSGTGRYTEELARRLPERSPDIDVSVLWPEDVPIPKGESKDALIVTPIERGFARIRHEQLRMERERKVAGADLVHYPANIGNFVTMRRTILTVHDLGFLRNPAWSTYARAAYHRITVHRSAKLARRVIADSNATAKDVVDLLGIAEDRIDVIPLGVEDRFQRASAQRQIDVCRKYALPESFFLYVGTLEPRKNLPRLIQAWASIAENCNVDLVIAGRAGWKIAPIMSEVERCGAKHRIHFPGFIESDDLPALLSAALAFVWPSLWEGFGLPPLEAMACGTPVLTSTRSSLPEVVGEHGLLVDPYDTEAIAQAMLRLAKDEKLRAELSEGGLERAGLFAWDRCADLTLDAYRRALESL